MQKKEHLKETRQEDTHHTTIANPSPTTKHQYPHTPNRSCSCDSVALTHFRTAHKKNPPEKTQKGFLKIRQDLLSRWWALSSALKA